MSVPEVDWMKLPYMRPGDVPGVAVRMCAGQTRDGNPCTNYAMVGGTHCGVHSSYSAKVANKKRLMAMIEPAMMVAYEIMMDDLNEPEVRLRAAIAIMDRGGFGPSAKLIVDDQNKKRDLSSLSPSELFEHSRKLYDLAQQRVAMMAQGAIEARAVEQEAQAS